MTPGVGRGGNGKSAAGVESLSLGWWAGAAPAPRTPHSAWARPPLLLGRPSWGLSSLAWTLRHFRKVILLPLQCQLSSCPGALSAVWVDVLTSVLGAVCVCFIRLRVTEGGMQGNSQSLHFKP